MQADIYNPTPSRLETILPEGTTIVLVGIVIFTFFSAAITAQRIFTQTRDELVQRKQFITSLAHQIRTPLAVLLTNNEVALYSVQDQETKKVLDDNIEEVKNITDILNNLLLLNKLNSKESLTFEPVITQPIIKSVIKRLAPYAEKHNITVEQSTDATSAVYGNIMALEQALYNLIKNAMIYSKPEGGTVNVIQSIIDQQLIITVEDTGIGIAEKDLEHIFDPSFIARHDDLHQSKGSGLGLPLVAAVIELHQGNIHTTSIKGVMTRVTLQLPVTQ